MFYCVVINFFIYNNITSMLASYTLRIKPSVHKVSGSRRDNESGTGSRDACYQSPLREVWGLSNSEPRLKTEIQTRLFFCSTISSPSSLTVYQLPQLGQRPKPVLYSYYNGSTPPSREPAALPRSITCPISLPPSTASSTLLRADEQVPVLR